MKAYKNVTIEVLELEEDVVRTSDGGSETIDDHDDVINASDLRP